MPRDAGGGNVSALAEEFDLPRSMMYRWRMPTGRMARQGSTPSGTTAGHRHIAATSRRDRGPRLGTRASDGAEERYGRGSPSSSEGGQEAVEIDFFK
ncbi:MAG: hypothetical protein U5J83_13485 [Bryobacterales bacterium]|nr:hypothetical protein [Bryobacterales bacterium]